MTQAKKQDDTRLNLASHDAMGERIEQLKALLPEIFVEGQIDPERLRQHLGDFSKVGAERYGLNWAGKADAIRSLQIPSHGTLVPMKDQSVNFDESENMIIEGDNLEVLKLLQKSYHGKIKMIYIDPPYNTGGDFIYPDNFKEGLDTYLRYSGQTTESGFKVTTNSENGGRFHSNWLNMMYPRLFMAKNLLRDDGVIFVSIDDSEVKNLRAIMDEIFGEANFISQIIVISNKRGQTYKEVAKMHEYILVYGRSDATVLYELAKEDDALPYSDSKGAFDLWELRNRNPKFGKHNRPNLYFPIYVAPDILDDNGYAKVSLTQDKNYSVKVLPRNSEGGESCWRWGTDKIKASDLVSGIPDVVARQKRDGEWNVYEKSRKSTKKVKSLWDEKEVISEQGTIQLGELDLTGAFDHPKPLGLLEKAIQIASEDGDIILDFFAGSGTTGHAAVRINKLEGTNRQFILVQLPEKIENKASEFSDIAKITMERVRRAIKQETADSAGKLNLLGAEHDFGFKAFRLTSSNFKLWDASSGSKDADGLAKQLDAFADNLLPGRSQDDVLYEVILKAGQPLTAKIEKIEVAGQKVFSIDGGAMLICLEDPIKEETLVGMLEYQPAIMVALDKAFHGNDQLKTNIKLQAEATGESEQSRVLFKTV